MAYLISEVGADLLNDLKAFCEGEIVEQAKEYDKGGEFPKEIYDQIGELGFYALHVPEELGGPGLDKVSIAALIEELGRADAGIGCSVAVSNLAGDIIWKMGSDELKKKYADKMLNEGAFGAFALTEPGAGSDPSQAKATAVKEGNEYVLNGRKCFITNASYADYYIIICVTDKNVKSTKGMTAFVVDKDTPGLSFGNHEDKMGIRCSVTCDVVMDNVRIPEGNRIGEEGEGFKVAMKGLDYGRVWTGCTAVGIAQRAMDEAIAYGKERQQFGMPVLKQQALQFKIADMKIKIETARQIVAHTVTLIEQGKPHTVESAIAKTYCSDAANFCATEAVQIFGGYGFMREYPVEKLMRDSKIFQIFEGTNEILHVVIAGNMLGKF